MKYQYIMKFSNYNSHIKLSEKTSLIYNSLSNKYSLLSNKVDISDINLIEQHNPKLWKTLIEGGYIIDSTVDELKKVKELRDKVDLSKYFFYLIVNPTLSCNFNCWYCYETHLKNSYMDTKTLNSAMKLISQATEKVPTFTLGFFGGEPLLYFKKIVKPLIIHTNNCCKQNCIPYSVTFTTNGYLITQEMVDFFAEYNIQSLQITLDGGRKEHNLTRYPSIGIDTFEKILENIKLLLVNHIKVLLRINCTDKNIDSTIEIAEYLKSITNEMKESLQICFKQVWQNAREVDLDAKIIEMEELFLSHGLQSGSYTLDNVRYSCYGDKKNSLLLNYNGDVYKCTAIDFENTQRDGYLTEAGEVIWENNSLNNRMNAKFQNPPCLKCRILPICNGGCSQKALEYKGKDYCILSFDEQKKDEAILERFKHYISTYQIEY